MNTKHPQTGERAILVHIHFPAGNMQEDILEFEELARSAGADAVQIITGNRDVPESRYFVGKGKAEEIQSAVRLHKASLVLFNHALSPAQERNLEQLFQCRVLDRVGLILDIFAARARTFEGQLQVELALLTHLSTRLVRGWTHLERQRGGIGLRGPGETQLETDRRLIRRRIQFITKRLKKVQQQRFQSRQARRRAVMPTVALIGYTNAGKSTLFNRLTGAEVYVADRLFATLDPTLRRIDLPEIGPIILADTVGFIRHLPHDLVEAFKATLEEVTEADLLLHVVDVNDMRREDNMSAVNAVLASIGAEHIPQVLVYNKTDLMQTPRQGVDQNADGRPKRVWISAVAGNGIRELQASIVTWLGKDVIQRSLVLTPEEAKLRADLYQLKAIQSEQIDPEGNYHLIVKMQKNDLEKLLRN